MKIQLGQFSAGNGMKLVQFQRIYRQIGYQADRLEKLCGTLPRKTMNQMGTDVKIPTRRTLYRSNKILQSMSTVDTRQNTVIHRLQTEFKADILCPGDLRQQL